MVAAAGNRVVRDLDPSSHAEVNAIRAACKKLGTWDLSGCVMYTSCECCPMCYATACWAGIRKVFYTAAWSDYSDLFSDQAINEDMQKTQAERENQFKQILQDEACEVWKEFRLLPDGARY
ncbi:nucleoside deaminase [Synechococcus sp. A10-1-5-9]|uniref:nucleoside deaminase n=1 Tax=Synechococcus sp. A10-1-5-9 TaxID=3392295 RepID=UPI0039E82E3F